MKFTSLIALASLGAAYVVPSGEILGAFTKNNNQDQAILNKDQKNPLDDALDTVTKWPAHDLVPGGLDTKRWIDQLKNYALDRLHDDDVASEDGHNEDEEYRIAKGETGDDNDINVNGKLPFPIPHLPIPSHDPPTKTIYQILNSSEHTTRLAEIINEDETLIKLLNNTDSSQKNLTLFAPSDHAFEKLPEKLPEPSKEAIRAGIKYHLADGTYAVLDMLHQRTVPSLLKEHVSGYDLPQRVAVRAGLTGLKVNFYSKVTAANIVRLVPIRPNPRYVKTNEEKNTGRNQRHNPQHRQYPHPTPTSPIRFQPRPHQIQYPNPSPPQDRPRPDARKRR